MRERERIILVDSEHPDWRAAIARSPGYACYLTAASLASPRFVEQLAYARELGKPVLVCVAPGTPLPAGLFRGIATCLVVEVPNEEACANAILLFMRQHLKEAPDA
jgi:hypothetical protein